MEVAAHHCEFDFGRQFLRHLLEAAFETADFLAPVGVHAIGVEVHYAHNLVLAEVQAGAHNFCRNVLD